MSAVSDLVDALRTEFTGEVSFAPSLPSTLTTPSVVVVPADPFLENETFGEIRESWDILAVVSFKDKASGVDQMRELSLRIRNVVARNGGYWQSATPRSPIGDDQSKVISVNSIYFKYPTTEITNP